jgi:hypothetical protein
MMSDSFEALEGLIKQPVQFEPMELERYDEGRAEADGLVWLYTEEELALGPEPGIETASDGKQANKPVETDAKSKARFEWASKAASQFRMALDRQREHAAVSIPRFTTEEEVLTSAELIDFVERLPARVESTETACIAEETKVDLTEEIVSSVEQRAEEKIEEHAAAASGEAELSDGSREVAETSTNAGEEQNETANGAGEAAIDSHGHRDNDWVEYAPGHFQQRFILAASPLTYTAPDNQRKKRWFMRLFGLVAILLLGSMLPPMLGKLHAPGARPSVASEAAAGTMNHDVPGAALHGRERILTVMAGNGETAQQICERFLVRCDASVMDEMGKLNPSVKDMNALENGQLIKVPVPAARKLVAPALQ